jgi:hypothetical protein
LLVVYRLDFDLDRQQAKLVALVGKLTDPVMAISHYWIMAIKPLLASS